MEKTRVIIVGGGFGGLTLAGYLNRRVARDVEVVVISSENHMVFTPMLAEVAGRSLSGFDVVAPGRQIAPRATWLTASVTSVDLEKNEVEYNRPDGTIATLPYTHLRLRGQPRCCSRHGSPCVHPQVRGRCHGSRQRSHRTF